MADHGAGHIGRDELAKLLEQSRGNAASPLHRAELHPQLAECAACREEFMDLSLLDRQLKIGQIENTAPAIVPTPHTVPTPNKDCPDSKIWREIASGLTNSEDTLASIQHASGCKYCGPLLHQAVSEVSRLNEPLSDAERERIESLSSASAEWRQRLVQQITGKVLNSERKPIARWLKPLWRPRFAILAASFLAIIAGAAWVLSNRSGSAVDRLLARAYSDKRTVELRIAGADYAPMRIARGSQSSFSERPSSLLKAESMIASELESHPANAKWLQAQAKADLLEGKYDAAVEALRHAQQLEPESPAILTDLATAHFQRALQADKRDEIGSAYEYLSQALKLAPDDPVALFNRAIVSEYRFLYQQALNDWQHYLRVDSRSQWATEARDRAEALREKMKRRESRSGPLLSPAEIAALGAKTNVLSEKDQLKIDSRVEEYLQEAVRSWLPQAFPEVKPEESQVSEGALRALFFLAELTKRRHGDSWLSDLLKSSSARNFPLAANALARSAAANRSDDYDISGQQADLAIRLFRASGNSAGALRAEFERTFAAQMERLSDGCRVESTGAFEESQKYSYLWLQIQFGLEESVCSSLAGDVGTDEKLSDQAQRRAVSSGYDALYLRALFFAADDRLNIGDRTGAANLTDKGLEKYWRGQLPAQNAHNLYAESAYIADAGGWPNLGLATWQEDAALLASDEDLLRRAWTQNFAGDAATAASEPQLAVAHYAEAVRLMALTPSTEASRSFAFEAGLRTARMQARVGHYDDAIRRLVPLRQEIGSQSKFIEQLFYSTLGEVEVRRNRGAEAEQALLPALTLAEKSLLSLGSDEERATWSKDAAPAYLAMCEAQLLQNRMQEALNTYERYLGAPRRAGTATGGTRNAVRTVALSEGPGSSESTSNLRLLTTQTIAAFAALPDGLAIWVYDDRGVKSHWIPQSTENLQRLAQRFQELSADPKSQFAALRRDSHSLYQSLVAPIEADLAPGRTLIIETDGWLASLPFEALLNSDGHYLTERVSIVHAFGKALPALPQSGPGISVHSPALIVGSTASSLADGALPLPDAGPEAEAVAGRFISANLLSGDKATYSAVLKGLPGAAVFHFAGHLVTTTPKAGLLLRGIDGTTSRLMGGDAVRGLDLRRLQLAVLSACGTASDKEDSSGYGNVTGAFLRAGVPHVVASRWAVDSTETRRFVDDFYKYALAGQPIPDALRSTSRNMLADPRTSHPYYWSAFAAYGRP